MLARLRKIWWLFLLLILAGLSFTQRGAAFFGHVDQVASVIIYPVLRMMQVVARPFEYVASWWHTTTELSAQVAQLEQERDAARAEVISLSAQSAFFHDIEELSQFKRRYHDTNGIISTIICKNISGQEHFFLVDGGSSLGIEVDMVAVYKNILVGRVVEVYPFYAKIILLTDRRCRVPAVCSKTNTHGVHEGLQQQEVTHLNFVSHLKPVEIGDMVLTSGQGLIFPAGFGIGTISHFEKDQLGVNWVITVKPYISFDELKAVMLIKKGNA